MTDPQNHNTETGHTPEPWLVRTNIDGVYSGTNSLVTDFHGNEIMGPRQIRTQATGNVAANAKRACDCVNACASIPGDPGEVFEEIERQAPVAFVLLHDYAAELNKQGRAERSHSVAKAANDLQAALSALKGGEGS